jgi:hypothetical protein
MQELLQSTIAVITVGPILNADGTVYITDDLARTDFRIKKNNTWGALESLAEVSHVTSDVQGMFDVRLMANDTSSLGRIEIAPNKAPLAGASYRAMVVLNFTGSNINQTGDSYSSAQRQQMAREAYGVSGTVWHLAYNAGETMGNDGLSWATAKLTAGAGVKTVIEVVTAGDLVLIGAGTFLTSSDGTINTPAGVSVRGAGTFNTILTGEQADGYSNSVLHPPTNGTVSDLTLKSVKSSHWASGSACGTYTGGAVFTNSRLSRVRMIGGKDVFVAGGAVACSAVLDDCIFEALETDADCIIQVTAAHNIVVNNPTIHMPDASLSSIKATAGTLEINGGIVNQLYTSVAYGVVTATLTGSITCNGLRITNAGPGYDVLHTGTGTLTMNGCEYNRANISGTITDRARIVTDTAGNAAADVKLVKTVDADTAITTRVDASTLAGKFAGITLVAKWLRGLFRKDAMDSTAKSEVNLTGGTFVETTDALESQQEYAVASRVATNYSGAFSSGVLANAPTGGTALSAQETRDAMKLAPTAGTPASGSVDQELDDILADTGTDGVVVAAASKTGYALSETGLDAIPITSPTGPATTFPAMVIQLWRRFFAKATKTSTQIKTYADNGTTVVTTQAISETSTTETQGKAS